MRAMCTGLLLSPLGRTEAQSPELAIWDLFYVYAGDSRTANRIWGRQFVEEPTMTGYQVRADDSGCCENFRVPLWKFRSDASVGLNTKGR